jgi:hypothetical protein
LDRLHVPDRELSRKFVAPEADKKSDNAIGHSWVTELPKQTECLGQPVMESGQMICGRGTFVVLSHNDGQISFIWLGDEDSNLG